MNLLAWILTLAAFAFQACAATITGKVMKITDDDTIKILDASNTQHRIRLADIDAPERKQPFGKASTRHLANSTARQVVTVEYGNRVRYGRIVGKILLNGMDLCLEQVRAGYAWHYKKYAREQSPADRRAYAQAEIDVASGAGGPMAESARDTPLGMAAESEETEGVIGDAGVAQPIRCGPLDVSRCGQAGFRTNELVQLQD